MDAVTVQHVTKRYRIGVGRARIREMVPPPIDGGFRRVFPRWWNRDTFNALEDVSLSVGPGTSLGLVGHNGAGKTTLLKIIAGVTAATSGGVRVSGRIAALIDALVGFHPDLTGRENIYLLGAMHGFSRGEMSPRIDRVLEFAEIDEMADTPIKRYSAGMAARLGFGTITALDVELLLVDEVLAVGDAAFQRKCVDWLDGYRAGGGTLLFVSHNLSLIRNMTEKVVWIDHGRVVDEGPTGELLQRYVQAMERRDHPQAGRAKRDAWRTMLAGGMRRWGAGGARVENVHFEEPSANGATLEVAISFEADGIDEAMFCVGFVDEAGHDVGAAASAPMALHGGSGSVRCEISPLPLRSGIYFPVVAILSPDGLVRDRWKLDRAVVVNRDEEVVMDFGPVEIPASWSET